MHTSKTQPLGDQVFDAIADHWPGALFTALLLAPLMVWLA